MSVILENPHLVEKLNSFISEALSDCPANRTRGILIESLHKAQELFGFLPEEVQVHVAKELGLQHSDVYGVISFYSYFTEVPRGRFSISVCTGTACFVRGANRVVQEFQHFLDIEDGQTTVDGSFSLSSLRCVGACSLAPVVMVNDKVYGNVTAKIVPDIINECEV